MGEIFSIKHDLARSCFQFWLKIGDEGDKISRKKLARRYTPSYGNSQLKMEILEFTSKEAAAPLMSVAAPLWFWKFREKKLDFFANF